jgi:hypothetical protein
MGDGTAEIATLSQKLAALAVAETDKDNVFLQVRSRHNATEAALAIASARSRARGRFMMSDSEPSANVTRHMPGQRSSGTMSALTGCLRRCPTAASRIVSASSAGSF